ncbi:MAG: hypothetical protein JWQ16_3080 [Novosphingobium sp.]|nr:hypothetical protein [Novosphingobium sp.]
MEKVFSRWPSQAQPSKLTAHDGPAAPLPRWMLATSGGVWATRLRNLGAAIAAAALVVILEPLIEPAISIDHRLQRPLATLLALSIVAGIGYVIALNRALVQSKARYEAIFERPGISMWLEDWSAAGRAILSLRQNGVHDMEAHFAARPDELRALRAQVMIKDVNAFNVEEARAPNKQVLVGPLDQLLPDTDQTFVQWLVAFAQGERFFRSEAHVTRPDGSESDTLFTAALPVDLKGFSNIIVTSLDITEYKSEQSKLRAADAEIARASRISTVGALSASIAHEVNSPLAAIVANAQAALRWLQRPVPDVREATEAVAAIVTDATRAKDVVARTRAFIGNGTVAMASFDVVMAAREANLLVERELRYSGAAVHLQAELGLPAVKGDVIQVQQVFTNLLLNAAQAMVGQSGAKDITITFKSSGKTVSIDIADTGPGIASQQLERVFDPFYTTKTEGMGMGLAICRNCIDAQGGNIWASSIPGQGATVHFTLPMNDA